ncbi:hypothetical protein BH10PSE18_BH10PSE18_29860 [soil metagenome]
MSKTQHSERAVKLKPRQMKRQRQQQSLVQQHRPIHYPEPDIPIWKPLG